MNHILYKNRFFILFAVIALGFFVSSCKKENSAAAPSISGIRALSKDSTISKALPGDIVVIRGNNLASATAISFYGFPATFNSGIFSENNLVVEIPPIKWDSIPDGKANKIDVTTPGGTVTYEFEIEAPAPVVNMASNENAVAGSTITLTGANFYDISKVIFPGGKEGTDLAVSGNTRLTVTVPDGISSGDSLRVTGKYGTGASMFVFDNYLSPATGFLANFEDGSPYFGWQWWGGIKSDDASAFSKATGNYIRINPSSAITAGDGSWYADNRAVMVDAGEWLPSGNLADPISNYALKFEINVRTPWANGSLLIAPNGNFNRMARYAPWEKTSSGSFVTDGWQTVSVPLTAFLSGNGNYDPAGAPAANISTLTGGTNKAPLQIMLYNDSTSPLAGFDAAIDNVRIVKIR